MNKVTKNGTKLPWKWQHKKRFILCTYSEQIKTLWRHAGDIYEEVIQDTASIDMDLYLLCMNVHIYIVFRIIS